MEKARSLFEQVSEDDREDMIDQIEGINQALVAGDEKALDEHIEELSEIIFYIES